MKPTLKWIFGGSRVDRLLLAATVVAGVRMMLIAAVFIGFDLSVWPWFKGAEVVCGLAYAVLEGKALGYVSQLWVKLKPKSYVEWFYWGLLAIGQLVLFASMIWVTGYAAAAVRREASIDELLGAGGAVAWSMVTTALNPLMVILIGIARAVDPAEMGGSLYENDKSITTRSHKGNSMGAFSVDELARLLARKKPDLTPDNFVIAMLESLGVELSVEEAEAYLLAAQRPSGHSQGSPGAGRRANGKRA